MRHFPAPPVTGFPSTEKFPVSPSPGMSRYSTFPADYTAALRSQSYRSHEIGRDNFLKTMNLQGNYRNAGWSQRAEARGLASWPRGGDRSTLIRTKSLGIEGIRSHSILHKLLRWPAKPQAPVQFPDIAPFCRLKNPNQPRQPLPRVPSPLVRLHRRAANGKRRFTRNSSTVDINWNERIRVEGLRLTG
jgi:hypothetical protein